MTIDTQKLSADIAWDAWVAALSLAAPLVKGADHA